MIGRAWPLAVLTLIGLCMGSFAATAGIRLARGEQPLRGRSRCDDCGATLGFSRTLPLVAYIGARGRCADCGERIGATHLLGEAIGGATVLAAAIMTPWPRAILIVPMALVLLTTSVVDAKSRRLPDALTLVVAILGLALAAERSIGALLLGLGAGAMTFLLLCSLRAAFEQMRGEVGLGLGDVKLMSALAIWLGLATPWAFVLASALGLAFVLVARPKEHRIPFGPMIALGAFAVGFAREAAT